MSINNIKIILLIFVSSSILSCKGQVQTEQKQAETKMLEIGRTVFEIDNRIWKIFQDTKVNCPLNNLLFIIHCYKIFIYYYYFFILIIILINSLRFFNN